MNKTEVNSGEETAKALRDRLMKAAEIPPEIARAAWFALSHLFLDHGATVVDVGCHDGRMVYAMAVLRPHLQFIGLDKSRRAINKARTRYELDNLAFKVGDSTQDIFDAQSIDCFVNAYSLHDIYSDSRYNVQSVRDSLEFQLKALKKEGFIFIRDFAQPEDDYVLLEMPDHVSSGERIEDLSESDFLVWYSEHARPRNDPGTGGFFLEELPAKFPKTRLFRLPYKWAYEFILRKDDRSALQQELPIEYTFFTQNEFRKELRGMGARLRYSGPYWEDDVIKARFEGKFKLYMDDGTVLGNPPTCFVAVVQKMAERKSLHIAERRPSSEPTKHLRVQALRDIKTGRVRDVVERDVQNTDIIPYRIDDDGALKVYVLDGVARSISNAVVRSGENIHGKEWSSHMVEAIALDLQLVLDLQESDDEKSTVTFARDRLGLKPQDGARLEKGPGYYPSPDYINEYVDTFYLKVRESNGAITPKSSVAGITKFQAKGKIRELDAQQILDAISLGFIPNSKLELQILALFNHLDIVSESWVNTQIHIQTAKITGDMDLAKIMQQLKSRQKRFKDIKGSAGELRTINSIFVEEGQARGVVSGLSAQDVDFVVHDHETINKAIVLPIGKSAQMEVHAGFLIESLPVPEKLDGKTGTISAPTFVLPPDITNNRLARKYVAQQFDVLPEMVMKMGEPYFCHVSVTPQKIYPFAVAIPPDYQEPPDMFFMPLYQLGLLNMRNDLNKSVHALTLIGRSFKYLADDIGLEAEQEAKMMVKEHRAYSAPDWGFPMRYEKPAFLEGGSTHPEAAPQPGPEQAISDDVTAETKAGIEDQPVVEPQTEIQYIHRTTGVLPFHSQAKETPQHVEIIEKKVTVDPAKPKAKAKAKTNTGFNKKPTLKSEFGSDIESFLDELDALAKPEPKQS